MHVSAIDLLLIALYGVFVLGIGFAVRRRISGSGDFLLAGRAIPAWVAGLAFLSANLGAQEMIGMAASGAKYGIMTSHFYWVGAIPAMLFVGVFMMPFYYGSQGPQRPRISQAPLRREDPRLQRPDLRGDDRVLVGDQHVRDGRAAVAPARLEHPRQHRHLGGRGAGLHLAGRPGQRDLQRGAPVLHDRLRLRAAGLSGPARGRRLGRPEGEDPRNLRALVDQPRLTRGQPDGRRVVRPGDGARLRAVVRLLVHRLPRRPARHGRRLDERRAQDAGDRGRAEDDLPVPGHRPRHHRSRADAASR